MLARRNKPADWRCCYQLLDRRHIFDILIAVGDYAAMILPRFLIYRHARRRMPIMRRRCRCRSRAGPDVLTPIRLSSAESQRQANRLPLAGELRLRL